MRERVKNKSPRVFFRETIINSIFFYYKKYSVYSASKLQMWILHEWLNARDCQYNDDGASRLVISDTDR